MKLSRYRVLLYGVLSPVAGLVLYTVVYTVLTRHSKDLERDWLFRLTISTIAMTIPSLATIVLAMKAQRAGLFSLP